MKIRVTYVLSHPIQYFVPLIQRLAQHPDLDLQVIFGTDAGARNYFDPGFGKEIAWDQPLLTGYRYTVLNPGASLDRKSFLAVRAEGIGPLLIKKNTDVVIIHGWSSHLNLGATLLAMARRIPILYRTEMQSMTPGRRALRPLKPLVIHPLARRVNGHLLIGTLNRQYYLQAGVRPERLFWAPYSIDTHRFREHKILPQQLVDARSALGLSPDTFRIVFAGKLIQVKRPGDLIEAVSQMPSRSRVEIMLIGDGNLGPEMEARAATLGVKAHFLGFRNQRELPLLYSLGDVLVLPSEHEPWGLVVNEAMTMGLPAIVSGRVGCGPDLIIENQTGVVHPVGDVAALARALEKMASDPEHLGRLKQGALDRIANFSIDRTLQGYLEAIHAVTGRTPEPDSLAEPGP